MKLYFLPFLFLAIYSCKEAEPASTPPNIIYILADDLGIGDIGAFNDSSKIKTPHLDQLANEGMKFTDAHTSSSVCTPTRYGIITGRYNWRSTLKNGVLTGISEALIPDDRTTIADVLGDNGYHTGFIGKWHLGWNWGTIQDSIIRGEGWDAKDTDNIDFTKEVTHTPNDLGFDYAYGHSGSLDMAPYVYIENGKATAIPDSVTVNTGKYSWWRKGPTSPDFEHEQVTPNFFNRGIKYISENAKNEKPYFLYLALPSPHTPILPTEEWQDKSGLNPYADFMMMIDDYVGKLVAEVNASGEGDNTIIIFTSDNGFSPAAKKKELEDKGHFPSYIYRGHKADIFEGGHRVPFIVKWPKEIKAGRSSDQIICTTDFIATCADIVGTTLNANEGEDSYSFLPILKSAEGKTARESIIHHSINGSFALRKEEWKLILCPGSGGWSNPRPNSKGIDTLPSYQLYNLAENPEETKNLITEYPQIALDLKKELVEIIDNGRSTAGPKQENDLGPKAWSQLEKIR
ncbi:sulfatase family protein [Portibacter lacus]|uniref:Arylsulfatase n=1 Tax=Portibacter lacus TaxID=1099794 RepID=A0AA37SQS2_9BACT|nr:arylsulfatase [Portibacter lacus]GLR18317.1 arylsulfatase [Portibacter lacus]